MNIEQIKQAKRVSNETTPTQTTTGATLHKQGKTMTNWLPMDLRPRTTPTHYAETPKLITDIPYADLDGFWWARIGQTGELIGPYNTPEECESDIHAANAEAQRLS